LLKRRAWYKPSILSYITELSISISITVWSCDTVEGCRNGLETVDCPMRNAALLIPWLT
jgi:hypothetical protein